MSARWSVDRSPCRAMYADKTARARSSPFGESFMQAFYPSSAFPGSAAAGERGPVHLTHAHRAASTRVVIHFSTKPMIAGVWNLLFGLVAVAAGVSGRFELPLIGGSTSLIIAGALVAAYGVFQIGRAYRRQRMR